MNHPIVDRRLIAVGASLLAATLACSAPLAQGQPTDIAVGPTDGSAATLEPTITFPPAGVVATPTTQPPPTAAPGLTPTATTCLYDSAYVADLTIPDGTVVQTGSAFTKTWRIKNNGCQTWPTGTTLIFVSGNQMSGPASASVPETAPNGTQDVSVNLKAPGAAGDYQGYWQLRTPTGVQFGDRIFVKIKATSPTLPTETPSGVDFTASYPGGVWSCTSGSATRYMYTAIVKNTGTVALKSASITLQSPSGDRVNSDDSNTPFQTAPTALDCNASSLKGSRLDPGETGWVSMFKPTTPLASGSEARLVIKLCSQDDQGGDCKTVRVNFTT